MHSYIEVYWIEYFINGRVFTLFVYTLWLGKPQKKVPPLMARPLRGGGGVKAGPLRKKELF